LHSPGGAQRSHAAARQVMAALGGSADAATSAPLLLPLLLYIGNLII